MMYSNGDANFSAQNFSAPQSQPLNPLGSPFALQGVGAGGWQAHPQPLEIQHALQQFIAQQVAAQIAQRQPFVPQNSFAQQQPFAQHLQGALPHHASSAGSAQQLQLQLLNHVVQSLQALAQQLAQLAAQHAQQLAGMNQQPFGSGQAIH